MSNERELERAGYDKWRYRLDDMRYGTINLANYQEVKPIGICKCCDESVFNNQLYVLDDNGERKKYYHYSCYNLKKKEESEES